MPGGIWQARNWCQGGGRGGGKPPPRLGGIGGSEDWKEEKFGGSESSEEQKNGGRSTRRPGGSADLFKMLLTWNQNQCPNASTNCSEKDKENNMFLRWFKSCKSTILSSKNEVSQGECAKRKFINETLKVIHRFPYQIHERTIQLTCSNK